jgi:anti-sigma factor RsiW
MNWLGHGGPKRNGLGTDPWRDRLSDYLDDEVTANERQQLEAHLEQCRACADAVVELRAVVQRADGLRRPSEPTSDLWPGIQDRLQARPRRVSVVGRRMMVVQPWLAAAAVLAIVCVAGISWLTYGRRAVTEPTSINTQAPSQAPAVTTPGVPPLPGDREYRDTVAHLRRVATDGLTRDPQVLDVLDRNLDELDRAIAEYQYALSESPGDEQLNRRLESSRRRKVDLLQHTATLAIIGDHQDGSALTTH